jgi:F-type H+-transporting ATPase subunit epsilon
MYLEIVTPDQKVFAGEVTGVQVPGSKGSFEVLENHAALVSSLESGNVRINEGKNSLSFLIDSGVIEVNNNKVVILAESAKKQA